MDKEIAKNLCVHFSKSLCSIFCRQLYDVVNTCRDFVEEDGCALFGALQLQGLQCVVYKGTLYLALEGEEELLAVEVEDVYEEAVALASGDTPILGGDIACCGAIDGIAIFFSPFA